MKDITGSVERTGNIDTSGSKEGSITHAGMGVVMSILSNMYTNKFLAVLREYCANALDSHKESGQERPIEVTLPSDFQPTLLIQDYGLGMSRDDIEKYFLEYGESTKRDTNDLVGAFGIGSKSAFTMGHQFVVTGVKDGQKTVALLALNESNIATCTVVKESKTREPNGVLVSLAVEDVDSMRETAAGFFVYWERGTVLVDGEEPTPIFEGATSVNDATFIQADHEGQTIVSMGGVPYVVGRDILRKVARDLDGEDASEQAQALVDWYSDSSLIFKVAIGDCDIAPTREGLRDTKRTMATLERLVRGLVLDLGASVQQQVDAARNPFEARMTLERSLTALGPFKVSRKSITFAGSPLKKEIETPLTFFYLGKRSYRAKTQVVLLGEKFTVDHIRAPKTVVITGVSEADHVKVTRYAKRFLEDYVTAVTEFENQTYEYIVPVEEATGEHDWFVWGEEGGVHTLTLEEYKSALRTLRETNPRTRNEPSYTTGWGKASRDLDERDLLTDILSWGKDIVVFHETSLRTDAMARHALADYTPLVLLGSQSMDMLVKRVEEDGSVKVVTSHVDIVKAYARKVCQSVTDDERAALGAIEWLDHNEENDWRRAGFAFGEEEITSQAYHDVREAFELARLVAADITNERKVLLQAAARHIGSEISIPTYDTKVPTLTEAYPLVGTIIARSGLWIFERNRDLAVEALAYINER